MATTENMKNGTLSTPMKPIKGGGGKRKGSKKR